MKKGIDYPGVAIVFLCHDGKGNFLLNKRSASCRDEHGRWDCGGGGLDIDCTVKETLKKEIQEEYRTKILKYEFLGYRDVHRSQGKSNSHWIALDFKVLVDRELVEIGEPNKFDEIDWFRLEKFPFPLHSQLPKFLNLYKERL